MARGGGLRALLPALCIVGAGAVTYEHRVLFAQTGANTRITCPNDETCMDLYGAQMEAIFARDSYGTSMWDTWTTEYLGKLDVPHTCNATNLIRNAAYAELFDRGVDVGYYTNVVIGLPQEFFESGGCEFTGLSDVGCSIGNNMKPNCTSMVWMYEYTPEKLEILLHELGHTLGVNHAGTGNILDGPAYHDKDDPQDPWKEYGDKTTLMGSQQAGDGMGFNGAERCLLNWIPTETVKTIDVAADNSGEYEVRLVNFASTPDAGVVEQSLYSAAKVRFPSALSASPSTPDEPEGRHSTATGKTVGATYYIRRVGMM